MALTFDLDRASKPRETKKSSKPRGSNPPGARTRKEPPRVQWREEITDATFDYMRPGFDPLPDTQELRDKVADALLDISLAQEKFQQAIRAFHAIGQLPRSIINDLPLRSKRYLKIWKQGRQGVDLYGRGQKD